MPKYFYKCSDCETIFEIYHSMNELKKDCTSCNSRNTLKKVPSHFSTEQKNIVEKKTGDLVEESIKEFRDELDKQKDDLKNEYI